MKIALKTLHEFNKAAEIRTDIVDVQTLKWLILIEFLIIVFLGFRLIISICNFQNLINLKIKKKADKANNEMIIIKEYREFKSYSN